MTTTQKWILAVAIVVIIAIFLFKEQLSALYNKVTKAEERIADASKPAENPVVVVPVTTPRPAPPTCDQMKKQIDYYTYLSTQYPADQKVKAILAELKARYASMNCEGGPKPNPTSAQ